MTSTGSLPSSLRRNLRDQRDNSPQSKRPVAIAPVFMASKSKIISNMDTIKQEVKKPEGKSDNNSQNNASKSKQFLESVLSKQKETKKSQEERESEVNMIRASMATRESIMEAKAKAAAPPPAPSTPRRASMWRLLTLQSTPAPVEASTSSKQRLEDKKAHFAKLGSVYATHAYASESVVQSPRNDEPEPMVDTSFTEGRRSSFEGDVKEVKK